MEMPFGKYRGWDIGDIPDDYLEWVLENVEIRSDALYDAIESKLDGTYGYTASGRRAATAPPPSGTSAPSGTGARTGTAPDTSLIEKVIRAWHFQMAKKYHTDRGGTHEQMLVVNDGAELLKRLAGLN